MKVKILQNRVMRDHFGSFAKFSVTSVGEKTLDGRQPTTRHQKRHQRKQKLQLISVSESKYLAIILQKTKHSVLTRTSRVCITDAVPEKCNPIITHWV